MINKLETDRLSLRPLSLDDEILVSEILCDAEIMAGFGGVIPFNKIKDWLAENLRRYQMDGYSYLGVYKQGTGEFIGIAGLLEEMSSKAKFTGVAYAFKKSAQGQGYALEAVNRLVSYGQQELGLTEIGAQIATTNIASQQLILAAGFKYEAEFQRLLADGTHAYRKYTKK